jgi:hypothetical protein
MSALPVKADISRTSRSAGHVPKQDVSNRGKILYSIFHGGRAQR